MSHSGDRDKEVTALRRILETPALAQVVPQLQPELLHRIIQSYGLEGCGEVVALATPAQLARVFDLDLWKAPQPGVEEQLDAGRFGTWLEVLMDAGPDVAAAKLTGMDADLAITALSRHFKVFDRAAAVRGDDYAETFDIGGYVVEAKRNDAWSTIIDLLLYLDTNEPDYFRTLMRGCRDLSNEGFELDGLDARMSGDAQDTFDLAVARETRRDASGYVAPEQARVFLQMSREIRLEQAGPPAANPIATAYFRAIEWTPPAVESATDGAPPTQETTDAIAEVVELLTEAGVVTPPPPRALLTGSTGEVSRLARIEAFLESRSMDEFGYLANTLLAGCSMHGRPLTQKESMDATLAVGNIGLEHWPAAWPAPDSLIAVFQVGWKVLHRDVVMHTSQQLLGVLGHLAATDAETDELLSVLRAKLMQHWRNGTPWHAREALDVLMILDTPAWAVLDGLIAECPVLKNPASFDFIAGRDQIASVHRFLATLPSSLCP